MGMWYIHARPIFVASCVAYSSDEVHVENGRCICFMSRLNDLRTLRTRSSSSSPSRWRLWIITGKYYNIDTKQKLICPVKVPIHLSHQPSSWSSRTQVTGTTFCGQRVWVLNDYGAHPRERNSNMASGSRESFHVHIPISAIVWSCLCRDQWEHVRAGDSDSALHTGSEILATE